MATAAAIGRHAEPAVVIELGTGRDGHGYARVASASEPGAVRVVTFADTRAGRVYRCSCPAGAHHRGIACRHVKAAVAEWAAQARWMAGYAEFGY